MTKGRPNKYFTHVEPNLDKIEQMALTMSEKQIAQSLGVGYTAWKEYKKTYPAINDHLKKGRQKLVFDLQSSLIKRAKGFNYEERKTIKEDGKTVREEIYTKASLPDVAAIHLLLKNLSENWRQDDKATLDLKREKLELEKQKAEQENW